MSLKAKLEAVIYAAEEPVTLAQLAQIFAADALEWQAAQAAAAAEANAEVVGEAAEEAPPLLGEGLEMLPVADTAAMAAQASVEAANAALTNTAADEDGAESAATVAEGVEGATEQGPTEASPAEGAATEGATLDAAGQVDEPANLEPVDAEAEARRLARQRDREIKAILKQILDEIIATSESDERGIEIREIAGGYRMATKPECHDAVRLFVKSLKPPLKLSLPALETLAVVAYKQPVTAPEVSEIRGVESGGVLGSLLARKLIATAGRKQVIGRPILYKTTKEFLLRFGLKDLAELPSMEEFEKMAAAEIEEMEPEAVAADAAQAALEEAEAAEPGAEPTPEAGEELGTQRVEAPAGLEENSPSGIELAGSTEAAEAAEDQDVRASEESLESLTDATSAEPSTPSNEPDAEVVEASGAPPAAPETDAPAENEAHPHAEEVEEEHGV
ncbi:SMC-Scp complex subunit ScpB [Occallatibacter riparius]|uniref:SMC-Scp complex subunit ScpB n=1 Tax=Occallatibacter riparius TaxID=1002689 RepID=A0A9J7BSV3_9BACT|nr:SMC-Scp complex subunit ScpB [Occallatibacter riparius]UWZ85979.1 SMC-Scp complex subunit ScpB [Occallatibacter riparius]